MRKLTLEKVMDSRGTQLIAVKKVPYFSPGDIIKLITPDGTYHAVLSSSDTRGVCDGCLFEDLRLKYGIRPCPKFKDDSFLCTHTQYRDKDTRFIPLDSVLEDL